ncbi:MAG TPA: ribosome maturation factor RimM [Smithellaceae bacterium]|nr:ribosome maturation factor RimM [Smithellaceae bacterium]HRS88393.1 ribosome maturation factor RimM [Smithellaceae bacterium]HRV25038.1 ribosome maturation factor RimM [Smithellaceae bacterium]
MAFFELGKVIKTRGLRGCLKVISYAEHIGIFAGFKHVYLQDKAGVKIKYKVKKIDLSGKFLFIELQGIDNKEKAQSLLGSQVFVPEKFFPQLPENEYYWRDIIGLQVYSEEEEHLGKIEAIFSTGSNDVYVCKKGKSEILLPSVMDVIKSVNLKQGIMVVKKPQGF